MSVAALGAALVVRVGGPGAGTAPGLPSRPAPARHPAPDPAAEARLPARPLPGERAISAAEMERALSAADPGTQDLVLEEMLTAWLRGDAQAAARCAELQADPFLREVALRTVAQRWARLDPNGAAQWAASLADETERDRAIENVALIVGESEPRAALDLLARRSAGKRPDAARVGVIVSWANRDFAAAQAWAEAQPPGPARDDITQRLVFLRAQTDPPGAAAFAGQMLGDETARRDAYASIVRPWVAREPEAAHAWAASADSETRRRADAEFDVTGPTRD